MVIYVKFLFDVACQKLLNMDNVSRSYSKNNTGTVFLRHGVDISRECNLTAAQISRHSDLFQLQTFHHTSHGSDLEP